MAQLIHDCHVVGPKRIMIDVHSNGDIDHLHVVYLKLLHIRFLAALTVKNVLYSSCSIQFIIPREDDSARTAKMAPILNTSRAK